MTTALSRKMHYWGTAGKNHDDTGGISCQMSESGMKNEEALSFHKCQSSVTTSDTLLLKQRANPPDLDISNYISKIISFPLMFLSSQPRPLLSAEEKQRPVPKPRACFGPQLLGPEERAQLRDRWNPQCSTRWPCS